MNTVEEIKGNFSEVLFAILDLVLTDVSGFFEDKYILKYLREVSVIKSWNEKVSGWD